MEIEIIMFLKMCIKNLCAVTYKEYTEARNKVNDMKNWENLPNTNDFVFIVDIDMNDLF